LTVLPRLDGKRKARVVQFLYEAGLIAKDRPILVLNGADLREVVLRATERGTVKTLLNRPPLSDVVPAPESAPPEDAPLDVEALIRMVNSMSSMSDLAPVDLRGAFLQETNMRRADLRATALGSADLSGADLSGADLRLANLEGADLQGAFLSEADLRGAEGITEEQLEQAKSLKGATMPNGQKYEDWLKVKEGHR
jgi:uncharacterized protein YjbI with pentapeptide repeats